MPWNFRKSDGTPDPGVNAFLIYTWTHARAALLMADLPGNYDVRADVYAAVYRRYPEHRQMVLQRWTPPRVEEL